VAAVAACRLLLLALVAGGLLLARSGGLLPASFPPDLEGALALLLVIEGVMRVLRDNTLEALALQSRMQVVTVLRGTVIACALLAMGSGTARQLLLAELAASSAAAVVGRIHRACHAQPAGAGAGGLAGAQPGPDARRGAA
jgi:hypothetical protein